MVVTPTGRPPRVLIADDQPDVLESLRLLLKTEGYAAETAECVLRLVHEALAFVASAGVSAALEEALDLITNRAGELVGDRTQQGLPFDEAATAQHRQRLLEDLLRLALLALGLGDRESQMLSLTYRF